MVIGSFTIYHLYLAVTNQTTIESLSPFLLLRHLPPLPTDGHSLSDPPLEPELSYSQRRLVKDAHSSIRLYDVGWKKNIAQIWGWDRPCGWVYRMFGIGAWLVFRLLLLMRLLLMMMEQSRRWTFVPSESCFG